jgi:DNA polymerase
MPTNPTNHGRDDLDELRRMTASLRGHLARQAQYGRWRVPAPKVELSVEPKVQHVAEHAAGPVPLRRLTLPTIREELGECTRCKLSSGRKNIVFGVGDPNAALVFIGEAPGSSEDQQGEPFVGDAGQLLTKMIVAMGWARKDVYIANILKCRPPGNRNPEADEIEACEPFLIQQLEAIRPRMIVALGKFAAQFLTGKTTAPIGALRGTFHQYKGISVMPTYHPAYLLRSPSQKRVVWEDLQLVMRELERLGVSPRTDGAELTTPTSRD